MGGIFSRKKKIEESDNNVKLSLEKIREHSEKILNYTKKAQNTVNQIHEFTNQDAFKWLNGFKV